MPAQIVLRAWPGRIRRIRAIRLHQTVLRARWVCFRRRRGARPQATVTSVRTDSTKVWPVRLHASTVQLDSLALSPAELCQHANSVLPGNFKALLEPTTVLLVSLADMFKRQAVRSHHTASRALSDDTRRQMAIV